MINKHTLSMLRHMMRGQGIELNMPVARKAYQKNLQRGYSTTVSLLAAIAAARVSAAANELDAGAEEFLSGLMPVDDLTGFGEICLPGQVYNAYGGESHDHRDGQSDGEHSVHAAHGSYLDDPFASRFDSPFSRGHDRHDEHQTDHSSDAHGEMASHAGHAAASGQKMTHSGHGNHEEHQAQGGHYSHAGNNHADHAGGHNADMTSAHVSHDNSEHHEPSHQNHASHGNASHTGHGAQITSGDHSEHEGHVASPVASDSAVQSDIAAVNTDVVPVGFESDGHDHSKEHQSQSVALADVIEVSDNSDHSAHSSHMGHDLAAAFMEQAPMSDLGFLPSPPEI